MDLADLKRRAEAARLSTHDIDGVTFTVRRPTGIEALRLVNSVNETSQEETERGLLTIEAVLKFVVDWQGMTVGTLLNLPADADEYAQTAPFDPDLLATYIADHVETGDKLAGIIFRSVDARRTALDVEKKD